MAINTYDTLLTAGANWLNRTDLTARLPEFVALAEARFRRELREWLRTSQALTNLTGDTALDGTVESVLAVAYNDGAGGTYNHPLELVTREEYQRLLSSDSAVRAPALQCFVDVTVYQFPVVQPSPITLRFYPPQTSIAALRVDIVAWLPPLTSITPVTPLLAVAPDVYLYGMLAESAPYLEHDERLPIWESRVAQGIAALLKQANRQFYGGQPRPAALPVVFG